MPSWGEKHLTRSASSRASSTSTLTTPPGRPWTPRQSAQMVLPRSSAAPNQIKIWARGSPEYLCSDGRSNRLPEIPSGLGAVRRQRRRTPFGPTYSKPSSPRKGFGSCQVSEAFNETLGKNGVTGRGRVDRFRINYLRNILLRDPLVTPR